MFVKDLNNSSFQIVNITNGYYYFFIVPNNYHALYYLDNNTLKPFERGNETMAIHIKSLSYGNSKIMCIY